MVAFIGIFTVRMGEKSLDSKYSFKAEPTPFADELAQGWGNGGRD